MQNKFPVIFRKWENDIFCCVLNNNIKMQVWQTKINIMFVLFGDNPGMYAIKKWTKKTQIKAQLQDEWHPSCVIMRNKR